MYLALPVIDYESFLNSLGIALVDTDVLSQAIFKTELMLNTIIFQTSCELDNTKLSMAQKYIVYAMYQGLDIAATTDTKKLIKKGLGRGAIVKEWEHDKGFSTNTMVDHLKKIGGAYTILKPCLSNSLSTFPVVAN